jgi:hypothetical protein
MDGPRVAEDGRPAAQAQRPARGLLDVDHRVHVHQFFRPFTLDPGPSGQHHQHRFLDAQPARHG